MTGDDLAVEAERRETAAADRDTALDRRAETLLGIDWSRPIYRDGPSIEELTTCMPDDYYAACNRINAAVLNDESPDPTDKHAARQMLLDEIKNQLTAQEAVF
ncbi:hypothetical protein D8I35_05495 [Corticibacter populi]|uniref:Uncharacterized protein n=2 Tax=Corticibacter populi TaxID=1550736 RepID=A0A3M6QZZ7_9BURK|nr:hypothetical protein D8I35_05495 [Corticibacter populi]